MASDPEYSFTLYVTRDSRLARGALAKFEELVNVLLKGRAVGKVVDLADDPGLADEKGIVATPMLVRERPVPQISIIGNLADMEKTLQLLGISDFGDIPD